MATRIRNALVALALVASMIAFAAEPALAKTLILDNSIFGSAKLGCALDYSNPDETRMIVTNTTGGTISSGRKLSWTTSSDRGAFILKSSIPAGQVFSFGLNAKGFECSVIVGPPQLVKSQ